MKRILFAAVVLMIIIPLEGMAQARTRYSEFGLGVGTLNAATDIATTTNTSALLKEMRPNFMAFGQYHFNDWFTLGIQASYGWTYMDDANHGNPSRGIYNRTDLVQVNPYMLMHLIRFGKYRYARKFTTYIKLGGGFIAYDTDPAARRIYNEDTEFYTNAYSGFNTFYGLGVKLRTSYKSTLSLEATFHNSYADTFDGIVSKGGDSNDHYGSLMLSYGFMIF
jgi:hypothetical protein